MRYPDDKPVLRDRLNDVVEAFSIEGYHASKGLYPVEEGWGRIDALDRIGNTVFGDDLDPDNYKIGNAPVSLPHLWDIWKFDWVQWNGSAAQPMARNVGEALGVKARLELVGPDGRALAGRAAATTRRCSSARCTASRPHCWQLRPPRWNEALLPPIDRARVARGRGLFERPLPSLSRARTSIRSRSSPRRASRSSGR